MEMTKLCMILTDENIDYVFREIDGGTQVVIFDENGERLADAVCSLYSYGGRNGLLEIMGALTEKEAEYDSVLGDLTGEEVAKRFIYCVKNNTSTYVE